MDAIEPFLRSIFAAPADDLPRLVFADWLDENNQPEWAELIRLGCESATQPDPPARLLELIELVPHGGLDRGFRPPEPIEVAADLLADAEKFRSFALGHCPHWYGSTTLVVTGGLIADPAALATIFGSPVTERVTNLVLRGQVLELGAAPSSAPSESDLSGDTFGLAPEAETVQRPVITVRMVAHLAKMREVRRLVSLDLRNNGLDNDALRAFADSPYFIRLERLEWSEGNSFKGRHWQHMHARFGGGVVQ